MGRDERCQEYLLWNVFLGDCVEGELPVELIGVRQPESAQSAQAASLLLGNREFANREAESLELV